MISSLISWCFFFFKQKTAYEIMPSLVGSEMCIRDRLAPTIGLTLIVNTITASKVFTELFPLFNGNPGSAYSLYTVVYYLYDMFYTKWELGPAAASAVVLFAIVLVLTVLQLFVQRKWKNY